MPPAQGAPFLPPRKEEPPHDEVLVGGVMDYRAPFEEVGVGLAAGTAEPEIGNVFVEFYLIAKSAIPLLVKDN